tara:strand:+ start:1480 stop:1617 length:138 start_codon:yes stop_codon:yes gene_type:complete
LNGGEGRGGEERGGEERWEIAYYFVQCSITILATFIILHGITVVN